MAYKTSPDKVKFRLSCRQKEDSSLKRIEKDGTGKALFYFMDRMNQINMSSIEIEFKGNETLFDLQSKISNHMRRKYYKPCVHYILRQAAKETDIFIPEMDESLISQNMNSTVKNDTSTSTSIIVNKQHKLFSVDDFPNDLVDTIVTYTFGEATDMRLTYDNGTLGSNDAHFKKTTLHDYYFFDRIAIGLYPRGLKANEKGTIYIRTLSQTRDEEGVAIQVTGSTTIRECGTLYGEKKYPDAKDHMPQGVSRVHIIVPWLNNTEYQKRVLDYHIWDHCHQPVVLFHHKR